VLEEDEEVDAFIREDEVQCFLDGRGRGVVCFAGVVD
jgi:hypothetical protein